MANKTANAIHKKIRKDNNRDDLVDIEITPFGRKLEKIMEAFDKWVNADQDRKKRWENGGPDATPKGVFGSEFDDILKSI